MMPATDIKTPRPHIPAKERLIVALDLADVPAAERAVTAIGDSASFYKIGYQLIPIGGLDLAGRLSDEGKKIFLDFKFHDIGATVERGVRSISKAGCDFLTVHAEPDVLAGAVEGRGDDPRLKILGVTVLTSLSDDDLRRAGIDMSVRDLVMKRAEFAAKAGADGIVASAMEAPALAREFGDALTIVTPGIRPAGSAANDQKRIVTPGSAIENGSDYLVVGRPIVSAQNPKGMATSIQLEIAQTLGE